MPINCLHKLSPNPIPRLLELLPAANVAKGCPNCSYISGYIPGPLSSTVKISLFFCLLITTLN